MGVKEFWKKRALFKLFVLSLLIFLVYVLIVGAVDFFIRGTGLYYLDNIVWETTLNGSTTDYELGSAIARGDINNDGFTDLIVGAHRADITSANQGQIYVFFGTADGIANMNELSANITINGTRVNDRLGVGSIATGDVNNDGYDDIIAGAWLADTPGYADGGQAYVFFGADLTFIKGIFALNANITFNSSTVDNENLGFNVASGDVNNDGYSDIIVGAMRAKVNTVSDSGQVHVFFGANYTEAINQVAQIYSNITFNGTKTTDRLGRGVSSGDINNDGYDDLIVGAYLANLPQASNVNDGQVFVSFGANYTAAINEPIWSYANITLNSTCTSENGYFGHNVASGDINQDGYADVVVGGYGVDVTSGGGEGQVIVLFGANYTEVVNQEGPIYANLTFNGTVANDDFGYSVASGDINQDGYHDVIVGAIDADPPSGDGVGQAYVFFGANYTTINKDALAYANVTLNGTTKGEEFGISVGSGDLNNDSFDEIIVGDYKADVSGDDTNDGQVFIFSYDNTFPATGLEVPVDFFNETATGAVVFNYTSNDTHLDTCELWGNWTDDGWHLNESFVSPVSGVTNGSSNVTIEDGLYVWSVYCNDTANNYNNTVENFTLIVNATVPLITLEAPGDFFNETSVVGDGNVTFNYTASDGDLDTCELWGNWTTRWHLNETFVSPPKYATNGSSNVTIEDGLYVWSVYCNDSWDNWNTTVENFTLTVDLTAPNITLDNPVDFYNETVTNSIVFNYTASDVFSTGVTSLFEIDTCELWGNWSSGWHLNETIISPPKDATNGSSSVTIPNGGYAWSVYCNDTLGNYNNTVANFTLTVNIPPPTVPLSTGGSGTRTSSSATPSLADVSEAAAAAVTGTAYQLSNVQRGQSQSMGSGDGALFNGIDAKAHVAVVKGVTWEQVILEIYSEPIKIVLKKGETKKLDLNKNSYDDFVITVKSINAAEQKAEIYFKVLYESTLPTGIVVEEEKLTIEEEKPEVPPTLPVEEVPSKVWLWILIIVILAVIGCWFMKKKKSK